MSEIENNNNKKPLITVADFLAGGAAGVTQIITGQPFDLIKVRAQMGEGSFLTVAKNVIKNEGLRTFYKGTLSPLIGQGFCIANQFAGFNFAKRLIAKNQHNGDEKKLTTGNLMFAGFFSGICYTWILSPMELFRIKMQLSGKQEGGIKYKSSIDAGVQIWKNHKLRGVYFGYSAATLRECIGSAIYFGIYETSMGFILPKYNNDRKAVPTSLVMLFGGISGVTLWFGIYPIDIVKTKIQASNYPETPYKKIIFTAKTIIQERGFLGIYNGLSACLIRAFVANSTGFVSYEFVNDLLKKKN